MLYYEIKQTKYTNGFDSELKPGKIVTCENSSYLTEALHTILSKTLGNALRYEFVSNADTVRVLVKSKDKPDTLAVTIAYQVNNSAQFR